MEILLGLLAILIATVIIVAIGAGLAQQLSTYRRDLRIVDMRNRDCSVSEIAKALNLTDEDARKAIERVARSIGPTPPT